MARNTRYHVLNVYLFILFPRGVYEDSAVVVDDNLVTSRIPADLPEFCKAIIHKINQ